MSDSQNTDSWNVVWCGMEPILSPFDMEAILRSCPKLLAHWRQRPFTFELDDNGRIITRYIA